MNGPPDRRITLVTGGAGQLGRHVVRRLLDDGSGVHVPVFGESEVKGLSEFLDGTPKGLVYHRDADLRDPDTVERLAQQIRGTEGRGPEILVNLAGGFEMSSLEETSPAVWERMMGMNATTAFLCARAVFADMKKAAWGRIVNVSAFPAIDRGQANLSAYGAAKAAVLNLTQTLAREGVKSGITANAVLPSIIDTASNRASMPGADTSSWLPPARIADVIAFLVSSEAGIVNGAAIPLTLD